MSAPVDATEVDAPDLSVHAPSAAELTFMERWEAAVHAMDVSAIEAMLSEDVHFHSPVVFQTYRTRSPVAFVLHHVAKVLPDLHYTNAYANGRGGVVLLFEATVEGGGKTRSVQGVDIFELDDAGQVASLTVMIRPMSGLTVVAERMRALVMGG